MPQFFLILPKEVRLNVTIRVPENMADAGGERNLTFKPDIENK